MKKKLFNFGLGMMCMAAIIAFGNGQAPTSQTKRNEKKDLTEEINDLKGRVRLLETEQSELRAQLERYQAPVDLSELARFDCEPEFNKAHAMAISAGTPGYTLEGAAALNCTQRLAKITEKAVHNMQNH